MKKFCCALVFVFMVQLLVPCFTFAEETPVKVVVDGYEIKETAIMEQDQVFVSEEVAGKMGMMTLNFDSTAQKIGLFYNGTVYTLHSGSKTVLAKDYQGEKELMIQAAPYVTEENNAWPVMMIPIRSLTEFCGADVAWDEAKKTVIVTTRPKVMMIVNGEEISEAMYFLTALDFYFDEFYDNIFNTVLPIQDNQKANEQAKNELISMVLAKERCIKNGFPLEELDKYDYFFPCSEFRKYEELMLFSTEDFERFSDNWTLTPEAYREIQQNHTWWSFTSFDWDSISLLNNPMAIEELKATIQQRVLQGERPEDVLFSYDFSQAENLLKNKSLYDMSPILPLIPEGKNSGLITDEYSYWVAKRLPFPMYQDLTDTQKETIKNQAYSQIRADYEAVLQKEIENADIKILSQPSFIQWYRPVMEAITESLKNDT